MKKLSDLKNEDQFIFLPNQVAYWIQEKNQKIFNVYVTNNYTEFLVINKNEKSVKVTPIDGRVVYIFKFKGKDSQIKSNDCDIIITKSV